MWKMFEGRMADRFIGYFRGGTADHTPLSIPHSPTFRNVKSGRMSAVSSGWKVDIMTSKLMS